MAKWADYLISAVRYTESNKKKYISYLKVHEDLGDSVGISSNWSKQEVIDKIDIKYSFITVYKNTEGNLKKGEDVRKIKIGSNYYLRTDSNSIEEDNLGNLPEF